MQFLRQAKHLHVMQASSSGPESVPVWQWNAVPTARQFFFINGLTCGNAVSLNSFTTFFSHGNSLHCTSTIHNQKFIRYNSYTDLMGLSHGVI